jgi:hypothetical protein
VLSRVGEQPKPVDDNRGGVRDAGAAAAGGRGQQRGAGGAAAAPRQRAAGHRGRAGGDAQGRPAARCHGRPVPRRAHQRRSAVAAAAEPRRRLRRPRPAHAQAAAGSGRRRKLRGRCPRRLVRQLLVWVETQPRTKQKVQITDH